MRIEDAYKGQVIRHKRSGKTHLVIDVAEDLRGGVAAICVIRCDDQGGKPRGSLRTLYKARLYEDATYAGATDAIREGVKTHWTFPNMHAVSVVAYAVGNWRSWVWADTPDRVIECHARHRLGPGVVFVRNDVGGWQPAASVLYDSRL